MSEKERVVKLSREDLTQRVSRWHRYLYDKERGQNDGIREAEQLGTKSFDRYPDFVRETFAEAYDPFDVEERDLQDEELGQDSEFAVKLKAQRRNMPEWQQLGARCARKSFQSGIAAASFGTTIATDLKPRQSPHNLNDLRKQIKGLERMGKHGADVGDRVEKLKAKLVEAEQEAEEMAKGLDETTLRTMLRAAIAAANQDVKEAEEAIESLAFGYGTGAGTPQIDSMSLEKKRAIHQQIKSSEFLKKLSKLAGRMRSIALRKQKSKAENMADEIKGIEVGDDLARLLASEAVFLADPDLELEFFRKYTERELLQYRMEGKEDVGRGPIVVCIDESGSMAGDRDVWAKAVMIGLLEVAQRQKRNLYVIHFDARVQRVDKLEHGQIDPLRLMEIASFFSGGGTSYQEPLRQAMGVIKEDSAFKKADILLITDGACSTDADFENELVNFKTETETSIYTVLVQYHRAYGAVKRWSDATFEVDQLLADEFHEVIYKM